MNKDNGIGTKEATAFLADYYRDENVGISNVALVGEGAWSRCFGFRRGDDGLVIRFGNHLDDFQKDQRAYGYAGPDLPVPQVLDIGEAFEGYYAISTRVHGEPLENVDADHWRALVPSVVEALEAMRTADLSSTTGFGGWGADGNAACASWSADLLSIAEVPDAEPDNEPSEERIANWREKLATSVEGQAAFDWGVDLLREVISDDVPRSLIHGDLINRNVLADETGITGVFDWGCSRYGDHLYDLAWFEFWAPWHPNLDVPYLRSELEKRWHEVGYIPESQASRLTACHLHIGLDHLAYNSFTGDEVNLLATAERMRALVE